MALPKKLLVVLLVVAVAGGLFYRFVVARSENDGLAMGTGTLWPVSKRFRKTLS